MLPAAIDEKLAQLIRRARRMIALRGTLATLAVAALVILAAMGVDAALMIRWGWLRWALSGVAFAAIGWTAWRTLIRPLWRKVAPKDVARFVEQQHPELEERISSAMELLDSSDPDELRGSETLIQEVVRGAVLDAKSVKPEREFSARRALRAGIGVAFAAAAFAAVFFLWPEQGRRLLVRAVAPYAEVGNAASARMAVLPGDTAVAEGDRVEIAMEISGSDERRAEILIERPGEEEAPERMSLAGETETGARRFTLALPSVAKGFTYRIECGRALSRRYRVTVQPRPRATSLAAALDFPAYTKLPDATIKVEGSLAAVAGTQAAITLASDRPLASAKLVIGGVEIPAEKLNAGAAPGARFALRLLPEHSGPWRFVFADEDGIENLPMEIAAAVLPDEKPAVALGQPAARELRLRPDDSLPLRFGIRDDFGISKAEIMVLKAGATDRVEIVAAEAPAPAGPGAWQGEATLRLRKIDLSGSPSIKVQIRAWDNLPEAAGGPQFGVSEAVTIAIDGNAALLANQGADAAARRVRERLADAASKIREARAAAEGKAGEMAGEIDLTAERARELEELRAKVADAEAAAEELAKEMEQGPFADLAGGVRDLTRNNLQNAREDAEKAQLSDRARDRAELVQNVEAQLDSAVEALDSAAEAISAREEELNNLAEMQNLANRQQELADQARELNDQNDLARWKELQMDLAEDFAKFADPAARDQALEEFLDRGGNQLQRLSNRAAALADLEGRIADMAKMLDDPDLDEAEFRTLLLRILAEQERGIATECGEIWAYAEEAGQATGAEQMGVAAQAALEAARFLGGQNLPPAAESAEAAGKQLGEIVVLPPPGFGGPAAREMMTDLWDRQRRLAATIREVMGGNYRAALAELGGSAAAQLGRIARKMEDYKDLARYGNLQGPLAEQIAQAEQAAISAEALAGEIAQTASTERLPPVPTLPPGQEPPPVDPDDPDAAADPNAAPAPSGAQMAEAAAQAQEAAQQVAQSIAQAAQQMPAAQPQPGAIAGVPVVEPQQDPDDFKPPSIPEPARQQTMQQMQRALDAANAAAAQRAAELAAQQANQIAQNRAGQIGIPQPGMVAPPQPQVAQTQTPQSSDPQNPDRGPQFAITADQQPGAPGGSGEAREPDQPGPDAAIHSVPDQLAKIGISSADWAKLKGTVQSGVSNSSDGDTPAEYRDMSNQYFREIAREGGE